MTMIDRNVTIYVPGASGRLSPVAPIRRSEDERQAERVTPAFSVAISRNTVTQAEIAAKLMRLNSEVAISGTTPLPGDTLGVADSGPFQMVYLQLPAGPVGAEGVARVPRWRVELHSLTPNTNPIGLDVVGDVVLGRGGGADLDLEHYGAYSHAVSRRHALLRPTDHHLFLIDMSSTNGTLYNSVPLGRCATHALEDDDVITLGMLSFVIKVVEMPGGWRGPS